MLAAYDAASALFDAAVAALNAVAAAVEIESTIFDALIAYYVEVPDKVTAASPSVFY